MAQHLASGAILSGSINGLFWEYVPKAYGHRCGLMERLTGGNNHQKEGCICPDTDPSLPESNQYLLLNFGFPQGAVQELPTPPSP